MITSILLNIVFIFITAIVAIFRAFGTASTNSDIGIGISQISSYLTPLNAIWPLDTLILILLFDLAFESLYFTYKLIRWGYRKVPGVN